MLKSKHHKNTVKKKAGLSINNFLKSFYLTSIDVRN
jgi:hypothetical protein